MALSYDLGLRPPCANDVDGKGGKQTFLCVCVCVGDPQFLLPTTVVSKADPTMPLQFYGSFQTLDTLSLAIQAAGITRK